MFSSGVMMSGIRVVIKVGVEPLEIHARTGRPLLLGSAAVVSGGSTPTAVVWRAVPGSTPTTAGAPSVFVF